MTDEQRKAQIEALLEERHGYELRGLTDRVHAVDAVLQQLGAEGEPPAKRATKRKPATGVKRG